jgi:hypothetical protein
MSKHEIVGRVLSSVHDRKSQSHRVRDISAAVHETLLAGIDLQHALPLVAWQNSLNGDPFLASEPVRLDQCSLADNVTAFKEVAVGVTGKCRRLDFSSTLHIRWHHETDLHAL